MLQTSVPHPNTQSLTLVVQNIVFHPIQDWKKNTKVLCQLECQMHDNYMHQHVESYWRLKKISPRMQ